MRTLLASALVLAACGPADRSDPSASHDAPSASQSRGSDPLVLRVARTGGRARVYAYGRPDSALWSAPDAPRLGAALGFDPEQGVIAFVDSRGVPGRIDLRSGSVARAGSRSVLANPRSADGSTVFGVSGGDGVRFTDGAAWEFDHEREVEELFPLHDGSVIAMSKRRGDAVMLWRLFPPQTRVIDSVEVRGVTEGPWIHGGDQLYFGTPGGLAVVDTRSLEPAAPITLESPVRDAVATPSGDRLFMALDAGSQLAVYERFRRQLGAPVKLPGRARALRMDPLGRFLLVRPFDSDSAWIVAVGTRKHVGTVRTAWRIDLPFVGPDGAVATAQGADVVRVDGSTLRPVGRVPGGANDFWYSFQWSGLRPRAAGIDTPVEFDVGVSDSAADSSLAAAAAAVDSAPAPDAPPAAAPRPAAPPAPATRPAAPSEWFVSFASVLAEGSAQAIAQSITVGGQRARVVTTVRDGTPMHRVILGPYADRAAADRAGQASGRPYWVYSATP